MTELELQIAKWAFGYQFEKNDMPRLGQEMLEQGLESEEVLRLSVSSQEDLGPDADAQFEKALLSVGLDVPSRHQAAITLAKAVASDLLEERILPSEGARIIWEDICGEIDGEIPSELRDFCVCASNHEDLSAAEAKEFYGDGKHSEMVRALDKQICEAARALVRR